MCGIFGALNLGRQTPFDASRFAAALKLLDHRGPDARRHVQVNQEMLLGHTRLSIIDLDERSNQPMTVGDRYWIVYNGEIYNYLELRHELQAAGVQFTTEGDTEVLLQAFIHWGEDCVQRFNGMWAFAIYDRLERKLFCSRDRYGEKPFCYAMVDDEFVFASELKAILAYRPELVEPEHNTISNFCRTSVGAQHAQTWFRRIRRLQPGHSLVVHDGRLRIVRHWHYPEGDDVSRSLGFEDACLQYRSLFEDAVRIRLRSDVPLGLTLSSGIDSSSIACVMHRLDPKPHHFFCSTFADSEQLARSPAIYQGGAQRIDEAKEASRLASELGQNFHSVVTNYGGFCASLSRVIYHLESGNSSPAVIPLMQLQQEASRHVKVVLEGQGADELLGGYVANVLWPAIAEMLRTGRLRDALDNYRAYRRTYTSTFALTMWLRGLSNRWHMISRVQQRLSGVDDLFGPQLRDYQRIADYPDLGDEGWQAPMARVLRQQHSGGLVNLLHYGDALSMAHGVESRLPFLDHRLVEFVWRLPADFKLRLGLGKYVHREAMRGWVPARILDQPLKLGFNSPISQQFRPAPHRSSEPLEILLSRRCMERGLFDARGLKAIVSAHQEGRRDHGPLLFRLLSTELWFRRFVDDGVPAAVRI